MPTNMAEKTYDVLCKFAEANPSYYEKETFVFHYGVLNETHPTYQLNCMDGAKRTFTYTSSGKMKVDGVGSSRVNGILWKMSEELSNSRKEANV